VDALYRSRLADDGRDRLIKAHGAPLRGADGQIRGALLIFTEVHEIAA